MKNLTSTSKHLLFASILFSSVAVSDDTEMFVTDTALPPNVIFIFDSSGSMSKASNEGKTRLQTVQDAAKDVISSKNNMNIGIMRFNKANTSYGESGGKMLTPLLNLDQTGNKSILNATIDAVTAVDWTPSIEAYYEASNYLLGKEIKFQTKNDNQYSTNNNIATYKSGTAPIIFRKQVDESKTCQTNHIILFTDGSSSKDHEADSDIHALFSSLPAPLPKDLSATCQTPSGTNPNATQLANSCGEELAYYLKQKHNITTHTMGGFDKSAEQVLKDIAKHGGGTYAFGDNVSNISAALDNVFNEIEKSNNSFAAPALATSAYNFVGASENVFYPLFKATTLNEDDPNSPILWRGNLKYYKVDGSGILRAQNSGADGKRLAAIDSSTGTFSENAQSYWSNTVDGALVTSGGLIERLSAPRKVYTYLGNSDLTSVDNSIENTVAANYTNTDELDDETELNKVKKWVSGLNENNEARKELGDAIHTRPVVFNYKTNSGTKPVLFMTTNDGYLHAVDVDDNNPNIIYSFIPKELLKTAYKYYKNDTKPKLYGLDGQLSFYHEDTNKDKVVDSNEKLYLYIGMRRGGSSYYALDVSSINSPKFMWQINGHSHPSTTRGFDKLGQTWSEMTPIKLSGQTETMLVFGGGYDIREDNNSIRTDHSVGNAIFFVNAKTGVLYKTISNTNAVADFVHSNMRSGIVSNIIPINNDNDDSIDILYAADLGGRIWRVDVNVNNSFQITQLADLNDGSVSGNRRFFSSPDISYSTAGYIAYKDEDDPTKVNVKKQGRFQIAIGSGYRARPLSSQVNDAFFVINDLDVNDTPDTPAPNPLSKSDLANYETSPVTDTKRKRGVFLDLSSSGEKVLANSLTTSGKVFFSTFTPSASNNALDCKVDTGTAKRYSIELDKFYQSTLSSDAPKPKDENGNPIPPKNGGDKTEQNCQGNCASEPPILVGGPNCKSVLMGKELANTTCTDPILKTFWRERE